MAPPAPATAATRRPAEEPQPRAAPRRPSLRVFEPEPRRSVRRGLSRRGHVWLGVAMVVGSLLAVVVADAMVAQGQVRMAAIQSKINDQLTIQKSEQSEVAQLAAPDRVVAQGINHGLIAPAQVVNLPQVPLNVPLPAPDTSPLPVLAKPATTHAMAAAAPKPASGTTATAATTTKPAPGGIESRTKASSTAPSTR
jgi:cell division protein FtsL